MKTKIITTLSFMAMYAASMACPVCDAKQPKVLRGIVHGLPQSDLDYVIVGVAITITLYTLAHSIKLLLRPGEKEENHIKQSIL